MFNNLAQEVFQILKGSGKTLSLYNDEGTQIYKPEEARKFFAEPENFVISINENGLDSTIAMYLSKSADISQDKGLVTLIDTLRNVATRHNILFNVRKYAKELRPKDFAYQAEIREGINMTMYGSSKTSYQRVGNTRLIIRHSAPVKEGVIGSRGRNIRSIFVENADGERFLYPHAHLAGARAMASHIDNGGKMADAIGTYIVGLSEQYSHLAKISTHIVKNNASLAEGVDSVRESIRDRAKDIRLELGRVVRNYTSFSESFTTVEALVEGEEVVNEVSRLASLLNIQEGSEEFDSLKYAAPYTAKAAVVEEPVEEAVPAAAEPAPVKQDPFTAYASQWFTKQDKEIGRMKTATGKVDDVALLANALKRVAAGKLGVSPAIPKTARFVTPDDEYRVKLMSYLDAEHKIPQGLWSFITYLTDKLSDGRKLTPNEKFFADKLVAGVGVKEGFMEEHELEEWFKQFDPMKVLTRVDEEDECKEEDSEEKDEACGEEEKEEVKEGIEDEFADEEPRTGSEFEPKDAANEKDFGGLPFQEDDENVLGGDEGDDLVADITFDPNADHSDPAGDEMAASKELGVIEDGYDAIQNLRRLAGV